MKKIRLVALLLVLLVVVPVVLTACDDPDVDKLIIYNWGEYIYDEDLEDFKEYYFDLTGRRIQPTYETFDTNETMLTQIMNGDSKIDVMCPSDYAIQKLLQNDLLMELNYFTSAEFENSQYVDVRIVNKIQNAFADIKVNGSTVDMTKYFVPYMYGTLGILYNKAVFEENGITQQDVEDAGWGVLFNKDANGDLLSEALTKKIYMKDSVRDSYAAAVFYLLQSGKLAGTSYENLSINELINCVDTDMIARVEAVLIEQKSQLRGYEVDFGKDDMIRGDAYVDLAWSGDAVYAISENEDLEYFIPQIAGNIWFDGWVIPKTANPDNVEAAKIFIDFLNDPVIAAQNMGYIGYASAISEQAFLASEEAMEALMEASEIGDRQDCIEYFFSDVSYPDIDNQFLGVMKDFGDDHAKVVAMWETVRAAGMDTWTLLIIIFSAVAAVAIVIFLVLWLKNRKNRRVKV